MTSNDDGGDDNTTTLPGVTNFDVGEYGDSGWPSLVAEDLTGSVEVAVQAQLSEPLLSDEAQSRISALMTVKAILGEKPDVLDLIRLAEYVISGRDLVDTRSP